MKERVYLATQLAAERAGTSALPGMPAPQRSWADFCDGISLFENAVRLRTFLWTIQKHCAPGSSLLEVGCGSGTAAVLLADMGYRVNACDFDRDLVARLSATYSDWIRRGPLHVEQTDMFELPWCDVFFDAAYHQGVLEHFADELIVAALKEQARVAKLVVFDVPNCRHVVRTFGNERLLSPRHWRTLISRAGLEVIAEQGRDFPRWMYALPHALFSHRGMDRWPFFGRLFAANTIFVCRSVRNQ